MKRAIYARLDTNEQMIDMREEPSCPKDYIEMKEERPLEGDYVATADGTWQFLLATPEEEDLAWKEERQTTMDSLTVEVDSLTFDGDETSQGRMARAASLADSPDEEVEWILHDNSIVLVTARQLRSAARAAGKEQTKLWMSKGKSKDKQ